MTPYRIALADDHQLFMDGMELIFKQQEDCTIVGTAPSGEAVLELLQKTEVDLVIMDINMPGMDGIETAKQIRSLHPGMHIMIVTMHHHVSYIKKLMRIGVQGYILKDDGQAQMILALKAIQRGEKFYSERVRNSLISSFDNSSSPSGLNRISLSKREDEVLQLVAKGLTTPDIASKLFVAPSTIMTHRKNIMQKLDVKNAAELIRVATENGLI